MRGTYNFNNIIRGVADAAVIGIIRDLFKSNKAYVFHGIERMARDYSEQRSGTILDICLQVKKFLKRTDFLHRVSVDAIEKKDDFAFLDPKDYRINRLSITYFFSRCLYY